MSDSLDKQMNAQKREFKVKPLSSHKAHKKLCDENESRIRKSIHALKILQWKEQLLSL